MDNVTAPHICEPPMSQCDRFFQYNSFGNGIKNIWPMRHRRHPCATWTSPGLRTDHNSGNHAGANRRRMRAATNARSSVGAKSICSSAVAAPKVADNWLARSWLRWRAWVNVMGCAATK